MFAPAGTSTSAEVRDLPPGIPIYFVVKACKGLQESEPSNEVVYVQAAPTPTPSPTVTPTPTPSSTPQPVRRRLTVNSGDGGGRYYPGEEVTVTADGPPGVTCLIGGMGTRSF